MRNGHKNDFLLRQNGSLPRREPISGNGHGVMNFMAHTVITHLTDQHLLMHFQKAKAHTVSLIWWGMYGR